MITEVKSHDKKQRDRRYFYTWTPISWMEVFHLFLEDYN